MNNKKALDILSAIPPETEIRVLGRDVPYEDYPLACSVSLLQKQTGERLPAAEYADTSLDLLQVGPEGGVTITAGHLLDVCYLLPDSLDWYVNMAPVGESMEAYELELEYQSERNVLLVQPTECVSC